MGNTSSLENTDPDPWWNQHQPHNNQNESQQTSSVESEITSSVSHETTRAQEDTKSLHEMWYQREQTLGQTIQHLAEENMRLSSARRSAEKRLQEFEAETQNTSEELDKLRSEAEKAQQVFEKLHAQIQSGREDRQMITSEMERIRSGFDAEREAKEQLLSEMRILREQRDENKRTAEFLNEQLKQKAQLVEKSMASFNQERREKECIMNELEKRKDELKATKTSLASATDSLKVQELSDNNSRLLPKESSASEESACARIRSPEAMAEMVRFQAEMSMRREARQRAMQAVSSEMERLRSELNAEREAREQAMHNLEQAKLQPGKTEKTKREETLEVELEQVQQKIKSDKKKIKELSQENERLQFELMNSREALTERNDELEKLQTQMETGRQQMQHQIDALKEVATICKEMLNIREGQVLHLTEKLKTIEVSVTKRVPEKLPVDLKIEYETQMENIRSLKALYEERMKLMMSEKEKLVQDSEEKSQRLDTEMKRSEELEQKITDMKLALEEKEEENSNLQIQLDDSHDKSNGLAKELTLINNLFTQMLIGSSATEMDLDRLTRLLQENHDLITDITIKEDSSEIAAVLPKLILDLVNQADSGTVSSASTPTEERNEDVHGDEGSTPEPEAQNDAPGESSASPNKTPEESVNGMAVHDIALNLPKVWKVLLELLSHHIAPSASEDQEEKQNSCYKSIDTPSGPRLVVSVSQTFLRLKDLILEKKSLQKELSRLKQLNGHLERKLNGQEQKLSVVSTELRKTWNVVDQMQTQHQKLHTHEKILRYELHEKRKMLNELKQELEYCREKWERARQKNSESEVEWRKLRKEFALRKKHPNDVLNNSGESGFLDERGDDSCEDDDTSAKDTGQLDPGIEEISGTEDIRTSSPIETGFSESNSLMDSSRMHTSSPIPNQEEILNQSQSELILDLESNELTNTVASQMPNNNHQSTFPSESSIHASDLCLSSFGPLKNNSDQKNLTDCNINSPYNNCSTISIITLLKHQLAFFSRNLDEFSTSSNMTSQNLEALESIFSLPPIQIPKALNDKITVQNCFHNYFAKNFEQEDIQDFSAYSVPSTSSLHNSTFDSRETENRISEDRSGDITAGTTLNTTDVNTKLPIPSASTPHNSTFDSRETENRIPDRSSTNAPVGINTPLKDTKGSDLDSSDTSTPTKTSEAQDQRINAHLPVLDACQAQSSKETTRANRTAEEIAEARAARLKRLEEQCQQLYNKVSRTTHRSTALCNRLEELHEQFRGSESPPGVRNDTTQSSEDNIPVAPPTPSSSENPTKSASSHSSCRISERKNIPTPPPLPNKLPTRRIETNAKSPQTDISNTQIPTPPPLLQQLPSQRIPSCIQMVQAGNGTVIPIPPPFPQSVRGRRLPTCMAEITNNTPDSQYSTDNCANESTTRHNDVQGQEELPQETNTVKLSTDANNETKDNGKH